MIITKCPKCNSLNIKINTSYEFFNLFECQTCGYWTYNRIDDCCREPLTIVVIKHFSFKRYALYRQCVNCGGSINRSKPLSNKKYGERIKDEFNDAGFNEWIENIDKERQQIAELKKYYNHINSPKYKYYLYLNSRKWKDKRDIVFKRDNYKCQICKINEADEVHHLTYENIENEKLSDLIAICHECHMKIHKIE